MFRPVGMEPKRIVPPVEGVRRARSSRIARRLAEARLEERRSYLERRWRARTSPRPVAGFS